MPNKKVMIVILLLIIFLVVHVLIGLLVLNFDVIQDWFYDHFYPIRWYRSSISVSYSHKSDEECLETIFKQLDIVVRDRVLLESTIKYELSSAYTLPSGWADSFGKKVTLILKYSDDKKIALDKGIKHINFDGNRLVIHLDENFCKVLDAIGSEKILLCIDDEVVKCDAHYFPKDCELELPNFITEGHYEVEKLFIRTIVSFYSYPLCSDIVVTY